MDLRLKDKVVLVTAASRGLGAAAARRFAEEGAHVAITARNGDKLSALAKTLAQDTGADVYPVIGDVTQPNNVERMVQSTIDRWGRLDVLVTNAGGPAAGKFLDLNEFRSQAEQAKRLPSFRAKFENLRLNKRIDANVQFISDPDVIAEAKAENTTRAVQAMRKAHRAGLLDGAIVGVGNAPTALMKKMGYGAGYKYPHNFEGHYVAEEYLPDALRGEAIVQLSESGLEKALGERWRSLRDKGGK